LLVIGLQTQSFGNLGSWGTCPATGQGVDPTIDAAVANAAGQEPREAVGEIADQMRSNSFDVPADAQTRRSQLLGVKAIDQRCDRPPLVSHRQKHPLTFIRAETHDRRISRAVDDGSTSRGEDSVHVVCPGMLPRSSMAPGADRDQLRRSRSGSATLAALLRQSHRRAAQRPPPRHDPRQSALAAADRVSATPCAQIQT
jgi:hypothetical protein